ncbi:hypothetical protein [Kineococcus rubinsiae]|uniref:hypothetical protein n=1 Tax=Kineococcus rubinsiae TaxID=2609562 RepID=UPI001431E57C|nr:hypothetical protein [Kineococcus rubinsiae]NIZ90275.1 hypothetical protein [Kineococcus rubinsiae]
MKQLASARAASLLVRVHRGEDMDSLDGYVAGVGRRWLLLARVSDDIWLTGWSAVRLRDVSVVEPRANARFTTEALRRRKQWPLPTLEVDLDLDSRRGLLTSLAGSEQVAALHPERRDPDVCFVGVVRGVNRHWVDLLEVTIRAQWDAETTKRAVEAITRVDIAGGYERALRLVAGPAPR